MNISFWKIIMDRTKVKDARILLSWGKTSTRKDVLILTNLLIASLQKTRITTRRIFSHDLQPSSVYL